LSDTAWAKKFVKTTGFKANEMVVLTSNEWAQTSLKKIGVQVMMHPMFLYDLSATSVRKRIADGQNWEELVPAPAAEYLKQRNLDKKIALLQIPAADRIGEFMQRSVAAAGLKGVILGVSGGIDSALLSVLANKTFGKKAHFYFLPFSADARTAKMLSCWQRNLKLRLRLLNLTK